MLRIVLCILFKTPICMQVGQIWRITLSQKATFQHLPKTFAEERRDKCLAGKKSKPKQNPKQKKPQQSCTLRYTSFVGNTLMPPLFMGSITLHTFCPVSSESYFKAHQIGRSLSKSKGFHLCNPYQGFRHDFLSYYLDEEQSSPETRVSVLLALIHHSWLCIFS